MTWSHVVVLKHVFCAAESVHGFVFCASTNAEVQRNQTSTLCETIFNV